MSVLLIGSNGRADPPVGAETRSEPTIGQVQRAAVRLAELSPGQARRWSARIRWAAVLPELRVRVGRNLGRTESLDLVPGDADQLNLRGDDDAIFEVRAAWSLDRLIFDSNEIRAAQQAAALAAERADLITLVTRLYFERRRIQDELRLRPPDDEARRDERQSHADEIEAILDGLTGGLFASTNRGSRARGPAR